MSELTVSELTVSEFSVSTAPWAAATLSGSTPATQPTTARDERTMDSSLNEVFMISLLYCRATAPRE